nr:hypothetical protein [Tanacetum cinerariifolium]
GDKNEGLEIALPCMVVSDMEVVVADSDVGGDDKGSGSRDDGGGV